MDIEFLIFFLVVFFGAILSCALGLILASSLIIQYLPNTRISNWLTEIWIDPEDKPDDIFNPQVGDCIKPTKQ